MASILVEKFGSELSGNGGATGRLDLNDNVTDLVYVGCIGWVSDGNSTSVRVVVTEIIDANSIRVLAVQESTTNLKYPNYTVGSDMSAFTTAQTARFDMPQQVVAKNFV